MSFGHIQLMPLLLDFARAFPQIQLDVSFSDRLVNVVDEGFDAAIRIGSPRDSSLIARKLCDSQIMWLASPAYLAAHGTPQTPQDLVRHACIIDDNFPEPLVWRFQTPDGAGDAVTVSGRMRFSSGEACLAAAEAGLGIARMPTFIAGRSSRPGRWCRSFAI